MSVTTFYSNQELPAAVAELKLRGGDNPPPVVLYFASARYDPAELSRHMQAAFPKACVVGCSSAGEIAIGQMRSESISVMFLDNETVSRAACAIVENLKGGVRLDDAFAQIEKQLQAPISSLDTAKYAGIVLIDGLSGAEEALMEKLGDRADLVFIGGSAGDDLKFKSTHVMLNGNAYTNAALVLILELKKGFDVIKTQSFIPLKRTLIATKVNEAVRSVVEFDGKPALEAYAAAIGVAPEQAAALFMRHPLGLMVDGDPFVRSPQCAVGSAINFYCQIKTGMELQLLEATDIVADTRKAIENRKAAADSIAGVIDFQCILRTLQLRDENRCGQYGAIFAGIPTAGFSTYGEAYIGHINQTSTMLVLH